MHNTHGALAALEYRVGRCLTAVFENPHDVVRVEPFSPPCPTWLGKTVFCPPSAPQTKLIAVFHLLSSAERVFRCCSRPSNIVVADIRLSSEIFGPLPSAPGTPRPKCSLESRPAPMPPQLLRALSAFVSVLILSFLPFPGHVRRNFSLPALQLRWA